jgi:hypothetical protein
VEGDLLPTRRMDSEGFVDSYPTREASTEYAQRRRSETIYVFPENGWVVIQPSGGGSKYLISVRDLAESIESDRFWEMIGGMVSLASMVLTVGTGAAAPGAAMAEIGFDILAEVFLPRQVQQLMFGATMVSGIIRGVNILLRLGRRGIASLRALRRASPTPDPVRVEAPVSTTIPETATVPVPTPPESVVMGRSAYRGTPRTVEGFFDYDARARVTDPSTGVVTDVAREAGEVLRSQSTREYRVAQTLGQEGRRVTRLPEDESEWAVFREQLGGAETDRLIQRIRRAQSFDRLSPTRNPDLLIEGPGGDRIWDIISQGPRGDLDSGVYSALLGVINKGATLNQSRRIVVDFEGYPPGISVTQIRASFRRSLASLAINRPADARSFTTHILEVAIVLNNRVHVISSRGAGVSF